MRLAEYVEHTVDVDGMLDRMTTAQFDEWCAKDIVEPIGDEKTRVILGMIGLVISKFTGAGLSATDFLPWVEVDEDPTAEGIKRMYQGGD